MLILLDNGRKSKISLNPTYWVLETSVSMICAALPFVGSDFHRRPETVREKKKSLLPRVNPVEDVEYSRLVSTAFILSSIFRASQLEKLWKWTFFCDMHVEGAF